MAAAAFRSVTCARLWLILLTKLPISAAVRPRNQMAAPPGLSPAPMGIRVETRYCLVPSRDLSSSTSPAFGRSLTVVAAERVLVLTTAAAKKLRERRGGGVVRPRARPNRSARGRPGPAAARRARRKPGRNPPGRSASRSRRERRPLRALHRTTRRRLRRRGPGPQCRAPSPSSSAPGPSGRAGPGAGPQGPGLRAPGRRRGATRRWRAWPRACARAATEPAPAAGFRRRRCTAPDVPSDGQSRPREAGVRRRTRRRRRCRVASPPARSGRCPDRRRSRRS